MTSQTKKFIELTDIVGLRLECGRCGCSLLIGVEKEDGPINELLSAQNFVLTKCPTCDFEWIHMNPAARVLGGASFDSQFKQLFRTMHDLKKILPNFGCAITLEIKDTEKAG